MIRTKVISKRSGGTRRIFMPGPRDKRDLRSIIPKLQQTCWEVCDPNVVHGFMPKRSAVTNGLAHIKAKVMVNFDLSDFFDTVSRDKVKLPEYDDDTESIVKRLVFVAAPPLSAKKGVKFTKDEKNQPVNQVAGQGLPTSPVIANIAAAGLDKWILLYCDSIPMQYLAELTDLRARKKVLVREFKAWTAEPLQVIYTRYADDLTISFNQDNPHIQAWAKKVREEIPSIVENQGFKVNAKKTKMQTAAFGRMEVTGVYVDPNAQKLFASRRVRRRLRAAIHQGNEDQVKGLQEWCRMPLPDQEKQWPPPGGVIERAIGRRLADKMRDM